MKKIILLVSFFPNLAFALGGYVGGGLGFADVTVKATSSNEDIYDPSFSLAGRVGLNINDIITVGTAFNSWIGLAEDANGNDDSVSVIPFQFEVNYHPMAGHTGIYFGLNIGMVSESRTVTVLGVETTTTERETGYGGQVGWNFALSESQRHTIGAEGRYIYVDGDPQTYNFLAVMALYNFWW